MNYGEIALLITAISGAISGILSYRQSVRTSRKTHTLEQQQTSIEREKTIWKQYEMLVDNLQEEVQRLRQGMAREREEIEHLSKRLREMSHERAELMVKITALESTVIHLRDQLSAYRQ